ncbi:hypothetical protein DMB92_06970 [Campylobacter sp. MIT 99-7217]|uniref:glycosyltransferase family 39 protein n=1 Tax=Campylobacter sp. MIT 99-7217 TaxID=535091 RepID=UPI00115AF4E8|nr:glycosyltransferase family 39 protein [Campylobacter sp. MIT 99-7217]TQR30957.1 hypothetical protein DMB92_06970 [Campylobacter sp. MIT 99-7217]
MKKAVILILCLDLLALLYGVSTLSIGANEAKIYFEDKSLLSFIAHLGTKLWGQNDFGLRFPFVLFHFLSCILLYILALKYTKTQKDAFYSLLLFILLPGSVASALLVNEASYVIFSSLLIVCAYEYDKKILFYLLLCLCVFIDKSFVILYLAFVFFAIYKKNGLLFGVSLALFITSLGIYGFNTSGRPRGYFLDTLGIFMACFSPLVFIYFFYVIYRLAFRPKKPLLWFLMSVSFIFCLLVSIRQRLYLEDFLPFCVICTPLLVASLMSSYRVRLPKLRLKYNIFIQCALIFLVFCYAVIIFNQSLYYVIKKPQKHFAYNYHAAKDLALELKKRNIKAIKTADKTQIRLKFYGITSSDRVFLQEKQSLKEADFKISLGQFDRYYKIKRY